MVVSAARDPETTTRACCRDYATVVMASVVMPVLHDLLAKLGPNFGRLQRWQGDMRAVAQPDGDHQQQKWWSEALGVAQNVALLDQVSSRDQARLLEQQG